ncbi:hypothetical protein KIH87_09855 [Paraneptunicella aestuarii]|uniref:hypothetical protein n=1 Tax=Paraneptunicella aestuarii TaxID=2831148 RepID=UPI001E528ACA|nr:hypothetical protein [Paraneptunicella aestuarii]UAA40615.1 hypothetical protein KIH87_09855 [Paraneptunicella aestuarii]
MRSVFFIGGILPFLLTSCTYSLDEHFIFECHSPDEMYNAQSIAVQGGGAAGSQYINIYITKADDEEFKTRVMVTSTSDKLILEWKKGNNLMITVDDVRIYEFKNHFDESVYWEQTGQGKIEFQYRAFNDSEKVSQCIN